MKTYTVNQLAQLAGISVRALHHYDEIGLLKPAFTGDNRYRYYGEEELLRLQQILIHRELDIPLAEIGAILDAPGFDKLATLQQQRERLEEPGEAIRQDGQDDRPHDRQTERRSRHEGRGFVFGRGIAREAGGIRGLAHRTLWLRYGGADRAQPQGHVRDEQGRDCGRR